MTLIVILSIPAYVVLSMAVTPEFRRRTDAELVAPPNAPAPLVDLQRLQMRQSLVAYQAEQESLEAEIAQKQVGIERGNKSLVERRKLVSLAGDRLDVFEELEKR